MNKNFSTPTHTDIGQRAQKIWQDCHCPQGRDLEIWLEAEGQLSGEANTTTHDSEQQTEAERIKSETAAESVVEFAISPASPDEDAVQAALQTTEARSPKYPHKTASKNKPPETGKPLWNKPHSS